MLKKMFQATNFNDTSKILRDYDKSYYLFANLSLLWRRPSSTS